MTLDRGDWQYRRDATLADFLSMDDLTKVLAETVRCVQWVRVVGVEIFLPQLHDYIIAFVHRLINAEL